MAKKIDSKKLLASNSLLNAALCYIEAGIPVLPLLKDSKKLPPKDYNISYADASTDPDQIMKWFGNNGIFADGNIGIATGREDGVFALDIDTKLVKGTNGVKELEKLVKKYGDLPACPIQVTPSGGLHYLFRWAENASSSSCKIANGIDTRGGVVDKCTGHIVAYPSRIGEKQYSWSAESSWDIPELPTWIVEALGVVWHGQVTAAPVDKKEVSVDQIVRMLECIDPDDLSYEEWVCIGMAIKSTCGEDGFELWDNWSERGSRRKRGECGFRWRSFDDNGMVGFGTLSYFAKNGGWIPEPTDVTSRNYNQEIENRVLQFNERFCLLIQGKTIAVIYRWKDEVRLINTLSLELMTKPETVIVMTSKGVADKPIYNVWLSHPARKLYHRIGIWPNGGNDDDEFNMWGGWAVVPSNTGSCSLWMNHVRDIVCGGDDFKFNWLLDWMADAVQDARNIKGTCIVMRGIEGCGKGVVATVFGKLFGKHFVHYTSYERLIDKFNSQLGNSIVVYADEAVWPGSKQAANMMKGLISEHIIDVESKGIDRIQMHNCNHLMIASNEEWIVPAGAESRRYFVLDVLPDMTGNEEYFIKIFDQLNNGGREALLYFLQNRKITNNLRKAPETEGLLLQRKLTKRSDNVFEFLEFIAIQGTTESADINANMGDNVRWPKTIRFSEFVQEYYRWCRERSSGRFDIASLEMFKLRLKEMGFELNNTNDLSVPELKSLREHLHVAEN